jgi:hypothetical protein
MKEEIGFSIAPGVINILGQAKKNERHDEHTVYLDGDLCQMAAQATFLKNHGIDVEFNNVYPCVKESEKEEAFQLIWKFKCNGWWNYRDEFAELNICTKEEFKKTLTGWCDNE